MQSSKNLILPHKNINSQNSNKRLDGLHSKHKLLNDGTRRSSAAGITHRPPLPPNIETRSQSLDRLLDAKDKCETGNNLINDAIDGALDSNFNNNQKIDTKTLSKNKSNETITTNRRSRSLDDLLDERDELDEQVNSKIDLMHEHDTDIDLASTSKNNSITDDSGIDRDNSEQPRSSETLVIDNTLNIENTTDNNTDDDLSSTTTSICSRQNSTQSLPASNESTKGKNNFINRYVKKVKSLIKK